MIVHTHIRALTPADLDAWFALQRAEMPDPLTRDDLAHELSHAIARPLGLFEEDGLVAAVLGWLVVDELQIIQVMTRADQRRRGLGRAVLREAMARARQEAATTVTLEVRASNAAALALYAAMGFAVDGRRPGFYPGGEDAVLMRRALDTNETSPASP